MLMPALMMLMTFADGEEARAAIPLPDWMAGCWVSTDRETRVESEECWTAPHGTMMLGSGHHYRDGRTVSFEHMRIEQVDGSLVFVALPGGETPTRFDLQATRVGEDLRDGLLFVNVANAYPQRVRYWRDGDALMAEIAFIDGREAVRWRFRRL